MQYGFSVSYGLIKGSAVKKEEFMKEQRIPFRGADPAVFALL